MCTCIRHCLQWEREKMKERAKSFVWSSSKLLEMLYRVKNYMIPWIDIVLWPSFEGLLWFFPNVRIFIRHKVTGSPNSFHFNAKILQYTLRTISRIPIIEYWLIHTHKHQLTVCRDAERNFFFNLSNRFAIMCQV